MGMFDIFTNNQPATPATPAPVVPAPGQPGNIPAPNGAVAPDGTIVAPAPAIPVGEPAVPDSPLAPFEKLWEAIPIDPDAPAPTEVPELKAEDVAKIMEKANFTPNLSDEQKAAITAGGEGAQAAFEVAMSDVARQVMTQATLIGNKLTERQVKVAIEKHMANLPELLRQQASTDHLRTTNPLFENPAVKPIIDALQPQLLQKHPNATHAEITQMAQDFVIAMGESFAPKSDTSVPGEEDWSKFL